MVDFDRKAREKNEREILKELKKEYRKSQIESYLNKKRKQEFEKSHNKRINKDDLKILNDSVYIKDKTLSQSGIIFYRLPVSIEKSKEVDYIKKKIKKSKKLTEQQKEDVN